QMIDGSPGFGERDAGLEPRDDPELVGIALLEAVLVGGGRRGSHAIAREARILEWDVEVGSHGDLGALKAFGRDADEGHRLSVEIDGLADDRGVGSEFLLPADVVEHGDWLTRLAGEERAATGGVDAEEVEIVGGNGVDPDALDALLSLPIGGKGEFAAR